MFNNLLSSEITFLLSRKTLNSKDVNIMRYTSEDEDIMNYFIYENTNLYNFKDKNFLEKIKALGEMRNPLKNSLPCIFLGNLVISGDYTQLIFDEEMKHSSFVDFFLFKNMKYNGVNNIQDYIITKLHIYPDNSKKIVRECIWNIEIDSGILAFWIENYRINRMIQES